MATTFQIAEVAKRPGFAPATVRYYVDIGLHTPRATGHRRPPDRRRRLFVIGATDENDNDTLS